MIGSATSAGDALSGFAVVFAANSLIGDGFVGNYGDVES